MAVSSCEEVYKFSQGITDGNCSLPSSCTCFGLLKSDADGINQQSCLDFLPVIIDEVSLPVRLECPFHSLHGEDAYSFSVVSAKGTMNLQCPSQLAVSSFSEVPDPSKSQTHKEAYLNCKSYASLHAESADGYSMCCMDIESEKKKLGTPIDDEKSSGSLKTEVAETRSLHRYISLQIGGRFLQLLMNHSLVLLKCTSREKSIPERAHEVANNRWRRYKRSASFDSRQIVLLFSILSSMGTMLLIYLTLRVKQVGDGRVPV